MISSMPFAALSHFSVNEWTYNRFWTCNFTASPRPHYFLSLVTDGYCRLDVQDKTIEVFPGEMFLAPLGSRYSSHWVPGARNITIMFSFFPDTHFPGDKALEIQKISPLYPGELQDLFERAYQELNARDVFHFSSLACFFEIMNKIMPRFTFSEKEAQDERIEHVVAYIDSHYKENPTISELAAVAQLSVPHFHVKFKQIMGLTPTQYCNNVRINHAITSLIQGGKTIETISEELGFTSATYFRRVFKKVTGCLPSKYHKGNMEV